MALIETWTKQELTQLVRAQVLNGCLFTGDENANLFGVELFSSGTPYSGGGTVSANVIRQDGETLPVITGTLSGNKASIVLPAAAYVCPGMLTIVIKLTVSGDDTTIGYFAVPMMPSSTETIADPGTIIPSIQDLISTIQTAVGTIPLDYSEMQKRVNNDTESLANDGFFIVDSGEIEQGSISTATGENSNSNYRIRCKNKIPVKKGMRLIFTAGTNCTHITLRLYTKGGIYETYTGASSNTQYTFDHDGYVRFAFLNGSAGTTAINPSMYDAEVTIASMMSDAYETHITENLVPADYYSTNGYTQYGVSYTVNDDGSITANGTATALSNYVIINANAMKPIKKGVYTLSGSKGGGANKYQLFLATAAGLSISQYDEPKTFVIEEDTYFRMTFAVANGATVSDLTVYPQLEKGRIAHAYTPSVKKRDAFIEQFKSIFPNLAFPAESFRGSRTSRGVKYTVNQDMSIVADGTASGGDSYYYIVPPDQHLTLAPGDYCLSGCAEGTRDTYFLCVAIRVNDTDRVYVCLNGRTIVHVDSEYEYQAYIVVREGATVEDVTFYPMLEAGLFAHAYTPPYLSNRVLFEAIRELGAKNIFPAQYYTSAVDYYRYGIHYHLNEDNSVTASGTATKDAYFTIVARIENEPIEAGTYTLSGCTGGSAGTYLIGFVTNATGRTIVCADGPIMFTLSENDVANGYRANILIRQGTTVEDMTFYPMLEKGSIVHPYKSSKENGGELSQVVSIGGEASGKIKNITRIMRQPWVALRDLDYYSRQGISTENEEYVGIPYASVFPIGGDVLYQRNLCTFFSAVRNPASIMYQPLKMVNGAYVQSNYGCVCTSLSGWINGKQMYLASAQLPSHGFERYEYTGMESVSIGDCMLNPSASTGHSIVIYDILVDQISYKPIYVLTIEQTTPWQRLRMLTIEEFENFLVENGGDFYLGRYPDSHIIDLDGLKYATDVIPDMGDKTYYYTGDTVEVYIPGTGITNIYIKKDDGEYATVALSGLSSRTVNDVTVYDISSLTADVGEYTITTDTDRFTKCTIRRINAGSISLSGDSVTLSGYSSNLTPVYAMVFVLIASETPGTYPSPTGYKAVRYDTMMIDGDTFEIEQPDPSEYDGYYVIAFYETGFGQAMKYSEYVMY